MKKKITLIVLLLHVTLTGCFNSTQTAHSNTKYLNPKTDDSILLVDRFSQKLVSYNVKSKNIEEKMNQQNFMFYDLGPTSDLLTAGHSTEFGFDLLEISQKKVKILYKAKDKEGIFPLAYSNNTYFLTKSEYDNSGAETKRTLIKYDKSSNKMQDYPNVNGLITYGIVQDSQLYYTVYKESENDYTLYSISINDPEATPKEIKTGLVSGEIFAQGEDFYTSSEKTIDSDTKSFKKESVNYFIGKNYLVQYQLQKNANLTAILTDTNTGKVLLTAPNIVDFSVSDTEITFYCVGAIEKYKI